MEVWQAASRCPSAFGWVVEFGVGGHVSATRDQHLSVWEQRCAVQFSAGLAARCLQFLTTPSCPIGSCTGLCFIVEGLPLRSPARQTFGVSKSCSNSFKCRIHRRSLSPFPRPSQGVWLLSYNFEFHTNLILHLNCSSSDGYRCDSEFALP